MIHTSFYSRVRNKRSPTIINFLIFFPGATALFWTSQYRVKMGLRLFFLPNFPGGYVYSRVYVYSRLQNRKDTYLKNQLLQYDVTRPLYNASSLVLIGITKTCNQLNQILIGLHMKNRFQLVTQRVGNNQSTILESILFKFENKIQISIQRVGRFVEYNCCDILLQYENKIYI